MEETVDGRSRGQSGERLHVVILGACNSGKSTLINILAGQEVSIVSERSGTTTDAVRKLMELPGIGASVIVDTAGFDDDTELGALRVEATRRALDEADVALLLVGENMDAEALWHDELRSRRLPVVEIAMKSDFLGVAKEGAVPASVCDAELSRGRVLEALSRAVPSDFGRQDLLRGLVRPGDIVMLVMPQDSQAPVGRLILPQVQTIRALLDSGCVPVCCTPATMPRALEGLSAAPSLVITDSQVFAEVYAMKPRESRLTSFSILMAGFKGDIGCFVEGAGMVDRLSPGDRVLIAESCAHAPKNEDIGRVKIPALLRRKVGEGLAIDFARGVDFPEDLTPYSLVIHCGGCMFNRRHILSRVERCRRQGVAITNYGILLAHLKGILDKVVY